MKKMKAGKFPEKYDLLLYILNFTRLPARGGGAIFHDFPPQFSGKGSPARKKFTILQKIS
ncbi:MAG: hypothetical protein IJD43_03330 [Thermoguttaceae bacterium]|nr:hypothetical protein [Planctomycetaceae bacterium]MBQ4142486.1 hypothetical protein [Thermoguttaceae bacterium]